MGNFEDFLNGCLDAYKNTSKYKDSSMIEIVMRKTEFEKIWMKCGESTAVE